MRWWYIVFIFIILVSPVAAADVTTIWEKAITSGVGAIDTDVGGNITLIGGNDGSITCYNISGTLEWTKNYNMGGIRKIVLAPATGRFVAQTWGHLAIYGDALEGTTLAEWDAYNYSYDNFKSNNNLSDVDISSSGEFWFVLADEYYAFINGSSNVSAVRSYNSYYNSGGLTNYTTYSKVALDPDHEFVIIGNSSTTLLLYKYIDNSANWYQNYAYRAKFTITGSTDGSLKEYPVNITIYNTTGATSGGSVYVGANTTALDWDDIRITASDGITPVQQWYRQQWAQCVTYSVVPEVLDQSTTYTYYLYYGNSSAERRSNATTKMIPSGTYDGGFDFNSYSNIKNATFDAEQSANTWGCRYGGTIAGGGSWTGACAYSAARKTNWSYSRSMDIYSYGDACVGGGTQTTTASGDSNLTFTLYPSPNGSVYAWNLTMDFGWYLNSVCSWAGACGGGSPAYGGNTVTVYIYLNGTLLRTQTLATACSNLHGADNSVVGPTFAQVAMRVPVNTPININITSYSSSYGTNIGGGWGYGYADSYIDHMILNATWSFGNNPSASFSSLNERETDLKYVSKTTVSGTITAMDLPWSSPVLALSTSSTVYSIAVSASAGFGTTYSAAGAGTPSDIKASNGGATIVEGRDVVVDIYDSTMSLDGTLSTGNTIRSVDVATSSGLWVAGGGDDGKLYVFSREGVSSWYTFYDSESTPVVTGVSLAPQAQYVAVGRSTGSVILYLLTGGLSESTYQQDVYIVKDGNPFVGCILSVYESTTVPYSWNGKYSLVTDDRGMASFVATEGYYYRFVNGTQLDAVRSSSASHAAMYLYITTTLPKYSYIINASGTSDTSRIDTIFTSPSGVADVSLSIINSTTGQIISQRTYSSTDNFDWTVYTGHYNWTYTVSAKITYPGQSVISWSQTITPIQGVAGEHGLLYPYLDSYQQNAIFILLLMVVTGLFSWANAHRGAIVVVGMALILRLFGIITIRYEIILLAAGVAVILAFTRGGRGV